MAITGSTKQNAHVYRATTHRKKTRQGAGSGTKYGRTKGSFKPNRGQGGKRKSIKR